jgi:hypothetical protein
MYTQFARNAGAAAAFPATTFPGVNSVYPGFDAGAFANAQYAASAYGQLGYGMYPQASQSYQPQYGSQQMYGGGELYIISSLNL